jgi:streptogramin lyase
VAPDGALWIGVRGRGVFRFDGVSWTTPFPGLAEPFVRSITVAPDGALWFSTDGGVSRFGGVIWTTYTTSAWGARSMAGSPRSARPTTT